MKPALACNLLLMQVQAKLLVEQNTAQSLTAHYEDLKSAQDHLANSYSQQQATITRLREDLDKVCATCTWTFVAPGQVTVNVRLFWTGSMVFEACGTVLLALCSLPMQQRKALSFAAAAPRSAVLTPCSVVRCHRDGHLPFTFLQASQQGAKLQGLYESARQDKVVSDTQLQVERSARQELDAQVRKVQEDAQAAKLALVAQTGVLEGQCKAATERIKQLEVRVDSSLFWSLLN